MAEFNNFMDVFLVSRKGLPLYAGHISLPLLLVSTVPLVEVVELLAYVPVTDPFPSLSARFEWGCEC